MLIYLNRSFSIPYSLYFSSFLLLFCFFNHKSVAQERNADSIFTVKKDTLIVKIIEVRIDSVMYQKTREVDRIYAVSKFDISKIIYGNGEIEMFSITLGKGSPVIQGVDSKYYNMVLPTPFQRSIAQWPTEKLIIEQRHLSDKTALNFTLGFMSVIGGPIICVAGIAKIFENSNAAGALIGAGNLVAAMGIPLLIFGSKNKKKARFIKMELGRRGIGN